MSHHVTEEMVERAAKAIARQIPTDAGSWNHGYGHNFPQEYSESERRLIRRIARDAITAAVGNAGTERAR
jgi:malic enzyme